MKRKLILYIAMSLDGYIAKKDDNIDFLSIVNQDGEDYGYSEFIQNVDTIIWGRRTYDKVLSFDMEFPYKDKNVYVISKSKKGKDEFAEFVNNPVDLVNSLKDEEGKNIYCDGGSEIVFELLKYKLFDQLIISVVPHLLGDGIKLFKEQNIEQNIKLKKSISFPSGLVQLWYDVKKHQ